ncbi:MAG: MBOAT family protein [Pseudomonadota bacterium]
MVFSSVTFLFFFLPAFLVLYFALPWKNAVLLIGSLLFYAWGEARFLPLLLASALLNYSAGLLIARIRTARTALLWAGVAANLALLAYFKYSAFFASIVNQLSGRDAALPAVVLPLGISFFTFQGLSYLVDVYRGTVDAQKRFLDFAMYKAMFPQLIAGPIVRYHHIAADIERRVVDNARIWRGFRLFVAGLAQKVLIANTVGQAADGLFGAGAQQLSMGAAWLAAACYSNQILFDFAGYSSMAIGIGHMLGFSYPANFDRPYTARSVTEFWRRWHMSLSSWFRDYVYIPLGGNRHAPWRTYLNLSLVFVLCGLWHGAAWTFVLWGAWHGLLLIAERAWLGARLQAWPAHLAQVYTLLVVALGWVLFRAHDVPAALDLLRLMFGAGQATAPVHAWQIDVGLAQWCALLAGTLIATVRWPAWRAHRPGAGSHGRPARLLGQPGRRDL